MFFGATIPKEFRYLCKKFMKDYIFIKVDDIAEKPKIEDFFIEVGEKEKISTVALSSRKGISFFSYNIHKYKKDDLYSC